MSWDKNTISNSEIDSVIRTLKDLNVKYKLTILGKVQGMGNNDDNGYLEESNKHPIRRLEYNDIVILERMVRHPDCDCDDVINSYRFTKDTQPKEWMLEETTYDPEYDNDLLED